MLRLQGHSIFAMWVEGAQSPTPSAKGVRCESTITIMGHYIKSAEGYDVKVPSQGQVDFATVGGALGIASFAGINANNLLGGLGWNNGWPNNRGVIPMPVCSEDHCVSRYELGMEKEIAAKDSEIALLKANTYNDQKMLEIYRYVDGKFNAIEARLAEQAVRNQGVTDAFREVQKDIDYKVNLEAERRNCADQRIVNYVNATFAPKLITEYTAGAESVMATTCNPLCDCGTRNGF